MRAREENNIIHKNWVLVEIKQSKAETRLQLRLCIIIFTLVFNKEEEVLEHLTWSA
jgi:hypothetical protein